MADKDHLTMCIGFHREDPRGLTKEIAKACSEVTSSRSINDAWRGLCFGELAVRQPPSPRSRQKSARRALRSTRRLRPILRWAFRSCRRWSPTSDGCCVAPRFSLR